MTSPPAVSVNDTLPLFDRGGLWRELRRQDARTGRPALFLDRDGVIVEEIGYLHRVEDMTLRPGAAALIHASNARQIPVVVVTNQSGVGRGYYDWADFAAVQSAIVGRLAAADAAFDMVLACGFHGNARPPLNVADHSWRKPRPGMLHEAAETLDIVLDRSWIIGDRATDLEAGQAAGLAGGFLVNSGRIDSERRDVEGWLAGTDFDARFVGGPADCMAVLDMLTAQDSDVTDRLHDN